MALVTFSTSQEAQQAAALMDGYHFELGNHDAPQWVSLWLASYPPAWIRGAVIEALYQGRYKAFSVKQILELWQKREKPIRHASHEFETTVCEAYGGVKLRSPTQPAAAAPTSPTVPPAAEPAKLRASYRTHQSLSSISFNLSEDRQPDADQADEPTGQAQSKTHHTSARTAKQELIETATTLQAQRQQGELPYSSARGIQPFKPALPFSAQTLRLAKQKALATR